MTVLLTAVIWKGLAKVVTKPSGAEPVGEAANATPAKAAATANVVCMLYSE